MRTRPLVLLAVFAVVCAACVGDETGESTTSTVSTTAGTEPGVDTTGATTTVPGTSTTTAGPTTTGGPTTTEAPTPTTEGLTPVTELAAGLFCRDLVPLGYSYADLVAYWIHEGRPDRMDADRNGIPCETLFDAAVVAAFWGEGPSGWPQVPLASLSGVAFADAVPADLRQRVMRDGFAIDPGRSEPHISWIYERLFPYGDHRPVFVTTDAAFHAWHLVFDKILRDTEEAALLPELEDFVVRLLGNARDQTNELGGSVLADAALRVEELLEAVGTVLELDVGPIGPRAQAEVALVLEHVEFRESPTVGGVCDPVFFDGCVDYSRMKPRGHYTRSDDLTRYFRAMSVLGNAGFSLQQPDPLRVGLLMSRLIASDDTLRRSWERIYQPTALMVGEADDYTPFEAAAAAAAAGVPLSDPQLLAADDAVRAVAAELRRVRQVEINAEAASVRVMGVRWLLDSFAYGELATPTVRNPAPRWKVSVLDLAAVLGSDWALERQGEVDELARGPDYTASMERLRARVDDRTTMDWERTIYDAWLHALVPSFTEKTAGHPPFMRTDAWTAKSHQTGFGSYAEVKHDTILYGKEAVSAEGDAPPVVHDLRHWVEPDPETFARIARTATLLRDGLASAGVLGGQAGASNEDLLRWLIETVERLESIAAGELADAELAGEDNEFLGEIGGTLNALLQWSSLPRDPDRYGGLIADIFLDGDAMEALEIATGQFDTIYVVTPDGQGGQQISTGGVYSFYEFWQPRDSRLSDEDWWDMLDDNALPARPVWVEDYLGL